MGTTPVGFERWGPGHPWGDVIYDDGSKTPVQDPDGSIEAETKRFGARANAMPPPAAPTSTPSLSGAADPLSLAPPPAPPAAVTPEAPPPPPPPPPMPTTAPLTAAEKAPLTPSPADLAPLGGAPVAAPGAAPPAPAATPAAQALAAAGVTPPAAPAAAPAGAASNPAEESIRALAPGLIPATASVQAQGPDAQSAQNILDTAGESLLLKGKGINQQVAGAAQTHQDEAAAANQAYFDAWKTRNQALGDEAAATRARDEASSRLSQAQARPIEQHADFSDWGVAISLLGAISGGLAEGLSGGRLKNTTLDMIQQLNREWVEVQKVNKGALVTDLERVLGDKNAAIALAQSKIKNSLADEADSRKRFARSAAGMRELEATANTLRAQALDDYNKSQGLVMGHVATSVNLARPAPGGTGSRNPIEARLRALGYTPEQYTKGLNGKVQSGENSPTIAMAATTTKQIDADISLLQSLAAANGGTLPTKGLLNVPQALIPALSKAGYKPGMQADEALALINTYVTQRAKSYGGVITESDRASAVKEMGASGESFIRSLERLRTANNNGVRTALSQQFPGAGQQMLDILLDDSGSYEGIPNPPEAPFEKQNVTETGPKPGTRELGGRAREVEAEKAAREERNRQFFENPPEPTPPEERVPSLPPRAIRF
ncbi:MAG: hypothetical protein A2V88_15435 [Elusimicrobia bacterium RBG_16_66_12]|nr:MAG: hypothetical protein A2V88_15435 [Elusimicrobia bacterium RBG_16_66_12]